MSPLGPQTTAEEVTSTLSSHITNRTFLITGTSAGGLGAYMATSLAQHSPAHLILLARSKPKVDPIITQIYSINPAIKTTFIPCDLTSQPSVRAAANTILTFPSIPPIDVLILNAGIMAVPSYQTDEAGIELQLSANHLGHFLLTNLLLPRLSPGGRVVIVSSSGTRISPFRFDDWNFSNGKTYDPWTAYGQSKTANVLMAVELARRGVTALAAHPGTIMGTGLGRHLDLEGGGDPFGVLFEVAKRNTGREFALSAEKTLSGGAATILAAALDPGLAEKGNGKYLEDCRVCDTFEYALDEGNAGRLWALSEELVGEKFRE